MPKGTAKTKKLKGIKKIVQISGDYKQIWALTDKGKIYAKEYIDRITSTGCRRWSAWREVEDIPETELRGLTHE